MSLALFVLYVASVLARIIPFRLTLASWQLEFAASLIDAAPIALLGLILVHLAAFIDPVSPILRERKLRFSRMAIAASLGFLLLLPLNVYAVWTGLSNLQATRANVEADATRRLSKFRQAISSASTSEELQQRLESIGVPRLRQSDLSQPLPALKQRLLANLDKAEGNFEARKIGAGDALREGVWSLVQSAVKLGVSSLALALAFAAGAQRKNSDLSLLESWQSGWGRKRLARGRNPRKASVADGEYLRQLHDEDVP
jgi:hypothetical protein